VDWILRNERYLGRQIWEQRGVEREPSTGRKIMRPRPRGEWKVVARPELRIISDALWDRVQRTKREVREPRSTCDPRRKLSSRPLGRHWPVRFVRTGLFVCTRGGSLPRLGCESGLLEGAIGPVKWRRPAHEWGGLSLQQLGTNLGPKPPKHWVKRGFRRHQKARRVNCVGLLAKSAKPPSPVQIRAAPPILRSRTRRRGRGRADQWLLLNRRLDEIERGLPR
jgi:Recombinase